MKQKQTLDTNGRVQKWGTVLFYGNFLEHDD